MLLLERNAVGLRIVQTLGKTRNTRYFDARPPLVTQYSGCDSGFIVTLQLAGLELVQAVFKH